MSLSWPRNSEDETLRDLARRFVAGESDVLREFADVADRTGLLATLGADVSAIFGASVNALREAEYPAPSLSLEELRRWLSRELDKALASGGKGVRWVYDPETDARRERVFQEPFVSFELPDLVRPARAPASPVALLVVDVFGGEPISTLGISVGWRRPSAIPPFDYPDPSWAWPELGLWARGRDGTFLPDAGSWSVTRAHDRVRTSAVLLLAWARVRELGVDQFGP